MKVDEAFFVGGLTGIIVLVAIVLLNIMEHKTYPKKPDNYIHINHQDIPIDSLHWTRSGKIIMLPSDRIILVAP